jgi:sigma-B regulation protein RsbU (phosphoserine phosphatase)
MVTSPRTSDAAFLRPARPLRRDQVDELLKLQKAAKKISSILDLDQLIGQIVNDIAVSFGCVETNIFLKDDLRQDMVLAGVCGCTQHGKGHGLKIGKEGIVGYVAATGQMRYAPDVSKDAYYIACEPGTQSEVAIPLEVEGEVIGVFTASHHELDAFPPEQLRLLQALCSHVAVAVNNARRFQQERLEKERMNREVQEARVIQEALLPKSPPFIPGFSIAGLTNPAGVVGGDWYDFIALDNGHWGMVLADVSGKGTAAALLMSATRGMLRSLAEACCTPGEVLTKLNRLMVEDFPKGKFVTMIYGVLDPAARTFTFANAGHLPPLLVDSSGAQCLRGESGLPLGLSFGTFSENSVHLPEGSRLVLYSDGITEAFNGNEEEYGISRLESHFAQGNACAESILREVRNFSAPEPLRDDATVIVIQAEK